MAFLSCHRCARPLQPLEQTAQIRLWVRSDQEMDVGSNQAHLQDARVFIVGDRTKEPGQEAGKAGIDKRRAIAGRPDDVVIQSVDHRENLARSFEL